MPEEWSEINNYLRDLRARIRNEFREKTYLPLAGKRLPSIGPLASEIDKDPFVSPIHQVILQIMGRAYGGDLASAQIAAASRRNRVVRNVLKHLDHAQTPLILLGEPGSGKTMTLQQAAMLLAERESHRVFPRVPIYARLGEFYVEGKVDEDNVWEYIKRSVPSSIQGRINELERDGRLVIFFDGMDEMSRKHYGEHTEALSVFADWTKSKTLFSCRITDFSPRFLHQRLVILPFDRHQVAEYLGKYIKHFPVVIDGRTWTLKELAKHIMQGELPIEANNPFALWLLCLYIHDKRSWPASRVEMLRYYNERNYQRKNEERLADEPSFPKMERSFQEWARFAYLITKDDHGPAISVSMLQEKQDAAIVQKMIQVGKQCGILAESREKYEEYLIRFEHHRFQEFFAALYIHENWPPIDWMNKLDSPRWQETMVNLILMGRAGHVVHILADSIIELTEIYHSLKGGMEAKLNVIDKLESVLADRVEVASRIMHQVSASTPDVHGTLMPPFRETVSLLADYGNPITQVKMMRACQNVPEINFIEALRTPLNSPINWVRNQALILIASSQRSARAIGSDIATEIGYDLASGLFPKRLSAYSLAARTSKDLGQRWSLLAGSSCYLAYLIFLLAAAVLLYFGMWSLGDASWFGLPDFSSLSHPISIVAFGLILTITTTAALKNKPSVLGIAILASAIGLVTLIPVLFALWLGSWVELFAFLGAVLFFGFLFVYGVSMLIAGLIHFGILIIYLAVTMRVRHHGHAFKTFLDGAWKGNNYNWKFLLIALGYALSWLLGWWFSPLESAPIHHPMLPVFILSLVMVITLFLTTIGVSVVKHGTEELVYAYKKIGWAKFIGVWLITSLGIGGFFSLLNHFLHNWIVTILITILFIPLIGLAIIALLVFTFFFVALIGLAADLGIKKVLRFILKWSSVGVVVLLLLYSIGVGGTLYSLDVLFSSTIDRLIAFPWSQINFLGARILAACIWLILVVLLFNFLRPKVTDLPLDFFRPQKFPPDSLTPEDWKNRIIKADADNQKYLLLRTDHQALSLSVDQFLDVLNEVRPIIKQEPALSAYWEKRNRLEEALRQERPG